ncbi:hypothetical protein HZQ13_04545 [Elizabethkingia anophelis]|nr:hypothetical protein [Elizabethkingia anophelis]
MKDKDITVEDYFNLPVEYNNEELIFKIRLITFKYGYKFYININEQELIFENDDEGDLRVIVPNNNSTSNIDKNLVGAVIKLLRNHRPEQ